MGQVFPYVSPCFSEPKATSSLGEVETAVIAQDEQAKPSPNGVAPTGGGLPNHSSRLLSCAWVPLGGGLVCGHPHGTLAMVNPQAAGCSG